MMLLRQSVHWSERERGGGGFSPAGPVGGLLPSPKPFERTLFK